MTSELVIEPFKPEHLGLFEELAESMKMYEDLLVFDWYGIWLAGGPAFSAFDREGNIVGCAGISFYAWTGNVEAWALLSPLFYHHAKSAHRVVLEGIARTIKEYGLHRIGLHVPYGDSKAERWARRLGFSYEGLEQNWGPHQTWALRYARVM